MLRFVSLTLGVVLMAGLAGDDAAPISAEQAVGQIGKPRVVVEMTVKAAKDRLEKRGLVYLDSEEDFASPKNLGVAISAEAAEKFKKRGVADIAGHFKGKFIRVYGCVMRFEERPYLPVHDPKQISVVDNP
jgi:hypothetical protein